MGPIMPAAAPLLSGVASFTPGRAIVMIFIRHSLSLGDATTLFLGVDGGFVPNRISHLEPTPALYITLDGQAGLRGRNL